jgi:hypothetical protein
VACCTTALVEWTGKQLEVKTLLAGPALAMTDRAFGMPWCKKKKKAQLNGCGDLRKDCGARSSRREISRACASPLRVKCDVRTIAQHAYWIFKEYTNKKGGSLK